MVWNRHRHSVSVWDQSRIQKHDVIGMDCRFVACRADYRCKIDDYVDPDDGADSDQTHRDQRINVALNCEKSPCETSRVFHTLDGSLRWTRVRGFRL